MLLLFKFFCLFFVFGMVDSGIRKSPRKRCSVFLFYGTASGKQLTSLFRDHSLSKWEQEIGQICLLPLQNVLYRLLSFISPELYLFWMLCIITSLVFWYIFFCSSGSGWETEGCLQKYWEGSCELNFTIPRITLKWKLYPRSATNISINKWTFSSYDFPYFDNEKHYIYTLCTCIPQLVLQLWHLNDGNTYRLT